MTTRTFTGRRLVALAAVTGMLAAACTDDPTTESIAAEQTESESAEPTTDDSAEPAATETSVEETSAAETASELITIETDQGPTTSYVSSTMGGVRFEAPAESVVLVTGDHIVVTTRDEISKTDGFGLATFGLTSMLGGGGQLESVEQYLDAVREVGVEVTPTDTKIEVLGYELVGYTMTGGDNSLFTFADARFGGPVESGFGPGASNIEFLADTPSGVLVAGVVDPGTSADAWLPFLGTLIESIELTGPGFDPPLPAGEFLEMANAGGPPAPAEASKDVSGVTPLGEPFVPLEPGRYELLNFGIPVSVEVPDDWFVQPNFPGFVVLTRAGSIGPGDRDLVWINDIQELAPIAGGPIRAGDARPVDDIEAIISDPPAGLVIDDVERVELSGPNGDTMPVVSFQVSVDPASPCTADEPCDYALITSYGSVKPLLSTVAQRVWFFPEHPTGPAAMVAQGDLNSDFLSEAVAIMATLELRR